MYCYRVPHVIIGVGYLLSMYHNVCVYGWMGLVYGLCKALIPIFVCFLLFRFRMLGAADIKLYSIICSYYNFVFCSRVMLTSVCIGAFFSIFKIIQQKNLRVRFRYFAEYIKGVAAGRRPAKYYDFNTQGESGVIPFTLCILLATVVCMSG